MIFFVAKVEGHKFDRTRSPLRGYGFIRCNQKFVLMLDDGSIHEELLEGVPECMTKEKIDKDQAKNILETRLIEAGFKVGT
jgi:hypothetical protein